MWTFTDAQSSAVSHHPPVQVHLHPQLNYHLHADDLPYLYFQLISHATFILVYLDAYPTFPQGCPKALLNSACSPKLILFHFSLCQWIAPSSCTWGSFDTSQYSPPSLKLVFLPLFCVCVIFCLFYLLTISRIYLFFISMTTILPSSLSFQLQQSLLIYPHLLCYPLVCSLDHSQNGLCIRQTIVSSGLKAHGFLSLLNPNLFNVAHKPLHDLAHTDVSSFMPHLALRPHLSSYVIMLPYAMKPLHILISAFLPFSPLTHPPFWATPSG